MGLMTLRPMLVLADTLVAIPRTQMRRHPLAAMKDFDRRWSRAHFHRLACQRVRHAVPVPIECHMVIDVHAGLCPVAQIVTAGGQRM